MQLNFNSTRTKHEDFICLNQFCCKESILYVSYVTQSLSSVNFLRIVLFQSWNIAGLAGIRKSVGSAVF